MGLFTASTRRKAVRSNMGSVEALESRMMLSNTWYVSQGGNNGAAGSVAAPWASLQYAVNRAASGDTIVMRGGSYSGGVKITTPGLTITSAPGEHVSISSPIDNSSIEVVIRVGEDANNTTLNGLDISGGYWYAVKTESTWDTGVSNPHGPSGLRIINCSVHDCGQDIIKLTPATTNARIRNCDIYNSGRRYADNAEGIDAVQANNCIVRNNQIHDITTNGIYFKGGSRNVLIERNNIHDIGYSGILLGQSSDENWFDTATNPGYYENIDGVVRNNVVTNTKGAGIGAWAALRPQIYNNTLVNVAQTMFSGLLIQGQEHWIPDDVIVPSRDVTMYNNIVSVNSSRPVFSIRSQGLAGSLNLSNNLYYQNGSKPYFTDEVSGYSGGLGGWKALGRDTNSRKGNPQFNQAAGYYGLAANSPAANAGRSAPVSIDFDGNARLIGRAVDIGAQESLFA